VARAFILQRRSRIVSAEESLSARIFVLRILTVLRLVLNILLISSKKPKLAQRLLSATTTLKLIAKEYKGAIVAQ